MDKTEYFNKLRALQDSSDDEIDINEFRTLNRVADKSPSSRRLLKKRAKYQLASAKISGKNWMSSRLISTPSKSKEEVVSNNKKSPLPKDIDISSHKISTPVIKEIESEPQTAQSFVQETPLGFWQQRVNLNKSCLEETPSAVEFKSNELVNITLSHVDSPLCVRAITPGLNSNEFSNKKFITTNKLSPYENEISTPDFLEMTSTPTDKSLLSENKVNNSKNAQVLEVGSLVMRNSSGITSMLKKKKQKTSSISFASESERIITGKTVLSIQTEDAAPPHRNRIIRSRIHGAVWNKKQPHSIAE